MKLNINKSVLFVLFTIALGSCSRDEDLGASNITIVTPNRQGIDKWIFDNYVTPLNIEVKYKWDDSELESNKKLVPPLESQVEPFLSVVKNVWVDPYMDQSVVPDPNFLQKYSPKQLVLVGSLNYNTDGTVTLGTAEGGRKIVLYEVNSFSSKNKTQVVRMLRTMQHEFGHILHQNKMYPLEYKRLTPLYTATWTNYKLADAYKDGFISQYSRHSPDEDFVEMIATLLTMSKAEYEALLATITASYPDGASKIRQKEKIVVDYFSEKYSIDIYALQARIASAMASL